MSPKIACSLPLPDPLSPSPFLSFPMSTYTVLRLDKGAWSEKAVASTTPAPNTRRQKGAEKRAMGSIGFIHFRVEEKEKYGEFVSIKHLMITLA